MPWNHSWVETRALNGMSDLEGVDFSLASAEIGRIIVIMASLRPCVWFLLAACATQGLGDAPPPFDRYGIILDRKPFGEEVLPVAAVEKPVLPPEQSFTSKFKMTAVTRTSSGVVQVGLVDLKSNRGFLLGIGDSIEGVTVVAADYVAERARLQRDPEDYWVSMSGRSNHFEVVGKQGSTSAPPSKTVSPPAPGIKAALTSRPTGGRSSYAARRQSREEIRIRKELERLQAEEAQRLKTSKTNEAPTSVASVRAGKARKGTAPLSETGQALLDKLGRTEDSEMTPEETSALLQEYQKELIRSGQTPLPIPLTPETDRALVEEGVLPAQE
jgi:hypothetical protein